MAKVRKRLAANDQDIWSDADFCIPPEMWKDPAAIVYEIDESYMVVFKADSMALFLQQYTVDWNEKTMPTMKEIAESGMLEINIEGPIDEQPNHVLWEKAVARLIESLCPNEILAEIIKLGKITSRKITLPRFDGKPFSEEIYEVFWSDWHGESA